MDGCTKAMDVQLTATGGRKGGREGGREREEKVLALHIPTSYHLQEVGSSTHPGTKKADMRTLLFQRSPPITAVNKHTITHTHRLHVRRETASGHLLLYSLAEM